MGVEGTLDGKRTLVTGSGTGIGREIALAFAREGADVVLHYSRSDAGAASARDEILTMGRRATLFKADFDSVEQIKRLADDAISFLGGIDCLVNNAGITFNKPFEEVTLEQFDLLYHVNIRAQFFLTQRVVADMLTRGQGVICNISSIHGLQGVPEHAVYAGTKGAIIAYTRALAVELAAKGIRVNAIAPGWVTVENYSRWMPWWNEKEAAEMALEKVPIGRAGRPDDIARLAVFLCSKDSEFIVGQTIVADGGSTVLSSLLSNFRDKNPARCGLGYVPGA